GRELRESVMSKYVLAFRGQSDRTPSPEEEQRWGQWFASLGGAIADMGNRVTAERTLASRQFDPGPASLTGYVVINADDADGAAKLAGGCPGLDNGVAVEIARIVDA
ncbi:MAG TPA: hypothetical protein VH307_06745, partial [Streptosporangiaceae bacterium]|nr:hypothetical protein [Streptosporangiaceae bacterium]